MRSFCYSMIATLLLSSWATAQPGVAVPNPTEMAYGAALRVKDDDVIEAKNELGQVLLEGLKLDHPELTYQRKLVLGVVRLPEGGTMLRCCCVSWATPTTCQTSAANALPEEMLGPQESPGVFASSAAAVS